MLATENAVIKIKPRIFSKDIDGFLIVLDVPNCKECPKNCHEFCKAGLEPYRFRGLDVGQMKQSGFPKMCPLEIKQD